MPYSPYAKIVIYCAECGRQRGAGNHWFLLGIEGGFLSVFTLKDSDVQGLATGSKGMPMCGEKCLLARISKWASPDTSAKTLEERE